MRVYDEAGSKDINNFHIYIPNKKCEGCFTLDECSDTGLIGFDGKPEIPEMVRSAGEILNQHYNEIELRYGVVSWVM